MIDPATRTLIVEREMPHPPERVWRALTQAPLIADWLMANDFQPVVGHRFNLRTAPVAHWNGIVDCEVLAIEPCKRLTYTWNTTGDATSGLQTVVTFTLTATRTGTLLRMEQSGFRSGEDANYKGASYGWQRFVASLERVVAGLG